MKIPHKLCPEPSSKVPNSEYYIIFQPNGQPKVTVKAITDLTITGSKDANGTSDPNGVKVKQSECLQIPSKGS